MIEHVGGALVHVSFTRPVAPTPPDDETIASWLSANPWLGAFIRALNRPVGHVKAFPVGGSLTDGQIALILKANK